MKTKMRVRRSAACLCLMFVSGVAWTQGKTPSLPGGAQPAASQGSPESSVSTAPHSILGGVVLYPDLSPAAGATVALVAMGCKTTTPDGECGYSFVARTDANGAYRIAVPSTNKYLVMAFTPNFVRPDGGIDVYYYSSGRNNLKSLVAGVEVEEINFRMWATDIPAGRPFDPASIMGQVTQAGLNAGVPFESKRQIRAAASRELIEVNRATKQELMTLPGITDELAERIIEHRPIASKTDLLNDNILSKEVYEEISGSVIAVLPSYGRVAPRVGD